MLGREVQEPRSRETGKVLLSRERGKTEMGGWLQSINK
jgi:hypothetical protein